MTSKQITLEQFLTPEEIENAFRYLLRTKDPESKHADYISTKIIAPVIDRINEALQQENDPKYLAYGVIYCFNLLHKGKK